MCAQGHASLLDSQQAEAGICLVGYFTSRNDRCGGNYLLSLVPLKPVVKPLSDGGISHALVVSFFGNSLHSLGNTTLEKVSGLSFEEVYALQQTRLSRRVWNATYEERKKSMKSLLYFK